MRIAGPDPNCNHNLRPSNKMCKFGLHDNQLQKHLTVLHLTSRGAKSHTKLSVNSCIGKVLNTTTTHSGKRQNVTSLNLWLGCPEDMNKHTIRMGNPLGVLALLSSASILVIY